MITTALSFGAMTLSGHAGLRSLAWLTVLGLSCALLATLVVLPALQRAFGRPGPGGAVDEGR